MTTQHGVRQHMSPFYIHKCIFIVLSITVANEQTFYILKSFVLYHIYKTNMYTTFKYIKCILFYAGVRQRHIYIYILVVGRYRR